MVRIWHVKLRSGSDPIPLLVHALFYAAPLQVCSGLLNPVLVSARRFLRAIHCFSSRPLRHHGRQRAPPLQQSSSSSQPLWQRRRPLHRLSQLSDRRPADDRVRHPAASSRRLPQQRRQPVPAATAAARLPSRRRSNVDDQTCVAQAATGRQPASPGGCCTSELCQYRISFVTMALRDTLCNDSNDHSLIRSDRKGMRRERYPLDKVQGSTCRNTSCATRPLMDKL